MSTKKNNQTFETASYRKFLLSVLVGAPSHHTPTDLDFHGTSAGIYDCDKCLTGIRYSNSVLVFNADNGANTFESFTFGPNIPRVGAGFLKTSASVSFRCLSRLLGILAPKEDLFAFDTKKQNKLVALFDAGDLLILDSTPDIHKTSIKSPGPGFTRTSGSVGKRGDWHRSGSIVIRQISTNKTFILGQDEGTYFGCELPVVPRANTVQEAFTALMPYELRGKSVEFKRQGEWFFIPVEEKKVKQLKTQAYGFLKITSDLTLPKDSKGGNDHCYCGQAYVTPNGDLYFTDGRIRHDDHKEVSISGWHKVLKNTAVQSFSEQGVD